MNFLNIFQDLDIHSKIDVLNDVIPETLQTDLKKTL